MAFNVLSTKTVFFCLFLNSASYYALIYKQFIFICILNVSQLFFFSLDVIVESEDKKGILSSIFPITYDIVLFEIPFWNIANFKASALSEEDGLELSVTTTDASA